MDAEKIVQYKIDLLNKAMNISGVFNNQTANIEYKIDNITKVYQSLLKLVDI